MDVNQMSMDLQSPSYVAPAHKAGSQDRDSSEAQQNQKNETNSQTDEEKAPVSIPTGAIVRDIEVQPGTEDNPGIKVTVTDSDTGEILRNLPTSGYTDPFTGIDTSA
jgi:uncharacterized FlaG/YvyC family protein